MMIADDILKGYSVTWMAKEYDRDIDDLTKYIDKVTADGSLERMQKKITWLRSNNEKDRRGNQLL